MRKNLMNDRIRVVKPDGTKSDWLKAFVDRQKIIAEVKTPIEEGDSIERKTSVGEEWYDVKEATLSEAIPSLAHYGLRVEKRTRIPKEPKVSRSTVNVGGTGNTVVVGSTNTSISAAGTDRVRQALQEIKKEVEKEATESQRAGADDIFQTLQTLMEGKNLKHGVLGPLLRALPNVGKVASLVETTLKGLG